MAPSRRIAALVAVTALAVSACSSNDADREDVEEAMRDVGLPDDQASCIAERLDEELDQDQLNDLAGAADPDEFTEEGADAVTAAVDECVDGSTESSDTTEATGEGDDEGGEPSDSTDDTSDTTAEDEAGTTATTAG
jgi:hypothetical protein